MGWMKIDKLKIGDCFKYYSDYYIVLEEWNGNSMWAGKVNGVHKKYQFVLQSTDVNLITEKEFMEKENAGSRD